MKIHIKPRLFLVVAFLVGLWGQNLTAQDYRDLFKKLDPTVVTIQTVETVSGPRGIEQRRASGTGVIVDQSGSIMTAAHVVHTADQIIVKFVDGTTTRAQVVSSVTGADVALINVESIPQSAGVATLGDSDQTEPGEPALVIGTPFGIEHSLSIGHISGAQTRPVLAGGTSLKVIQTDASINHGNSGGPLFNDRGEVIGIVSHILSEGGGFDGIGFAVSINAAKTILLERSPFWTGFEGILLPEELSGILNVPQPSALLVQHVTQNSIAARAGLRGGTDKIKFRGKDVWIGGDVILEIQNTVCDCPTSFEKLHESLKSLNSGEQIQIKVLRNGEAIDLFLTMP